MNTRSDPSCVFDTDAITLWQKGNPTILHRVISLDPTQRFITIVTEIEQLQGRFQQLITASNPDALFLAQQRLDQTRNWLVKMQVLPFDRHAADVFGQLLTMKLGKLKRKDLLIAAIVLSRHYTLITRNVKDFRRVPGLKVEDWSR